MEIRIKESKKMEKITVIDSATGCCYANDYVLNAIDNAEYDDDDGIVIMAQDDFDWWANMCNQEQEANQVLCATRQAAWTVDNFGECEDFDNKLHQLLNGVEFEDQPSATIKFCKNYEI